MLSESGFSTQQISLSEAHAAEIAEALEVLAEDYDHRNGFILINALNNQLREDK